MSTRTFGLGVFVVFAWVGCSGAKVASADPSSRARSNDAGSSAVCQSGQDCDAGLDPGHVSAGRPGLCTTSGDCEEHVDVTTARHVAGSIDYPNRPPAGGDHNPCWGTWDVHSQPLGVEHWVHNLEHGGVVFLYHCPTGCASEVSQLANFVNGRRRALLTEYADMRKRFAVVAWSYRLQTDQLDLQAFEAFYAAHLDHGLESSDAAPPSSCP